MLYHIGIFPQYTHYANAVRIYKRTANDNDVIWEHRGQDSCAKDDRQDAGEDLNDAIYDGVTDVEAFQR